MTGSGPFTEREAEQTVDAISTADIVFFATYTEDEGFDANAFHGEIDTVEAMALASWLRSYARDLEKNAERQMGLTVNGGGQE